MAGKLDLMSLRNAMIVFASSRLHPIIHFTLNETTKKLCSHFHNIPTETGSTFTPISFTFGVDTMVVVKSLQILQIHGGIVGRSYPNNFLDIKNKSDEETVALMKECIDGKHGLQAYEVKVAVITIQVVPQGFSPYSTLVGRPQTIN